MTSIDKPAPRRDGLHAKFYSYCRRHELRFQRCSQCRTWRHQPREVCHVCASSEYTWERSAGIGRLYSWTVTYRAPHPGFADAVPYISAIVELDEGVRMVADLTGVGPEGLAAGLRVAVWFDDVDQHTTVPRFRQLVEPSERRGKVMLGQITDDVAGAYAASVGADGVITLTPVEAGPRLNGARSPLSRGNAGALG